MLLSLSIFNNDFGYRSNRRKEIHNYYVDEIKSKIIFKQAIDPNNLPSFTNQYGALLIMKSDKI